MAGIGFELKKLFHRRGLMAMLRAYGYAGVICAGPMLLGVLLQFGVLIVSSWWQVGRSDRDLLVCMITYTLLASLVLTSFLSMPVTRFLADMLFDHDEKMILPSFWGSTGIMLVVDAVLYTVFLLFSGATLMQGALCLWLFLEMIVNWNAMSYLTAIKDYKSILYSFVAAVLVAFVTSCALLALACPPVESLLFAVVLGYGVMLVWDVLLLHRYFPQSRKHPWLFFAVGRSVSAVGVDRIADHHRPVRPFGDHMVRSARHQGEGSVLWRAILRCARHAGVFDDSDHHSEFCGVGGSQFLPNISVVLQSVE